MLYQSIQIRLDSRIGFKISFNIFFGFFSGNAQILRQSKRTDSIYNTKINCFRISTLLRCHRINGYVKYLRSSQTMNILCLLISLNQFLIPGHMSQHTKFNLGIIRIQENTILRRNKDLSDQPSKLHTYRNILKVRLRTADPSGGCNGLVKFTVNSSILRNTASQSVRISGF